MLIAALSAKRFRSGLCSGRPDSVLDLWIRYGDRLIDGAAITVKLVALACIIGLILAIPLALARRSERRWIAGPAYLYIYFFRGTPLIVQLALLYYGLAQFEVVRESPFWIVLGDAEYCGLLSLTLNTTAYVAEILRGGIASVPTGEIEAAEACGMSRVAAYRRIVLPRAFRIAWPAYGNEVILTLKGSALVSTITVYDLMGETRSVFWRGYDYTVYLYAAAMYLILALVITGTFRLGERRMNRYLQTEG